MTDRTGGSDVLTEEQESAVRDEPTVTTRAATNRNDGADPPKTTASPPSIVPGSAGPESTVSESTVSEFASPQATTAPPPVRPSWRNWLSVLCALIAVLAAGFAVTAPTLRPGIVGLGNDVLGPGNPLSVIMAPAESAAERQLPALLTQLGAIDRELQRLRGDMARIDQRLADATAQWQEGLGSIDTLTHDAQTARARADAMEAANVVLASQMRAVSLIAIAARLRRDVDAGVPLRDDAVLLKLNAPYPDAIAEATAIIDRASDGVASMRDLAVGFDTLDNRIATQMAQESSWTGRGWARLQSVFTGGTPDLEAATLQHLRLLVANGRFNEAADLFDRSPWRVMAADWSGQVRLRSAVVRATQSISAYAVDEAEAAQSSTPKR